MQDVPPEKTEGLYKFGDTLKARILVLRPENQRVSITQKSPEAVEADNESVFSLPPPSCTSLGVCLF